MSNKEGNVSETEQEIEKRIVSHDATEEEKEKENVGVNEQTQVDLKMEKSSDTNSTCAQGADEEELEEDETDHPLAEPGKFFFQLLPIHCAKGKGGRKVYKCDVCGGVYRHAFSLKRHYLRTHINYEYLSEADISNCNISIQHTTKPAANDEGNDQEMNGLYRCHMCSQLFDQISQLKYHIINHPTQANDKRFPCNQCDMTFSHRQNLVRHLSVHSGEKPYPCRYCGKCFPTATNQKRHERIHEGVKPYVCNHCTSVFTQSGDLKKHIRKQHATLFHPCAFCVKYFTDEGQLNKHLTMHGENAETNQQEWVKRNTLATQNKRNIPSLRRGGNQKALFDANKFSCSTCSKKFGNYINLRRHEQSMHNLKTTSASQSNGAQGSNKNDQQMREEKMTDADFYADIAYNISDNLLNHLDGKLYETQQPTPPTDDEQNIPATPLGDRSAVRRNLQRDWTWYNFPSWFNFETDGDCSNDRNLLASLDPCDLSKPKIAISTPAKQDVRVESVTLSHSDMLYSLALSPVNSNTSGEFQCIDGVLDLSLPGRDRKETPEVPAQYWDLPTTFVCFACGENVESFDDMENHKINNHPNVYCTHLEIEGIKDVPLQLFKQHCSPFGILHNCIVPPVISREENLICTKCSSQFSSIADLHCHMLECGGHKDIARSNSRAGRNRRKRKLVKRGMKRKLEVTPQKKSVTSTTKKIKVAASDRPSSSSSSSSKTTSFACPTCEKKFSQLVHLDRHVKICSQNAAKKLDVSKEGDKQQHRCPYCDRTFTYLASLKKHTSDCVLRKDKRKSTDKEERKSGKRSKKNEHTPQPSSEPDEETNSSTGSEDLAPPPAPSSPPQPSSPMVVNIKQEITDEQVIENVQCCDVTPEEEEEVKKYVAEIKSEDDKKGDGHCHACPHCRRTYTYLANFKKHVSEACPLRKDVTKETPKDDDNLQEIHDVEDDAEEEEVEEVEKVDEEENESEEVEEVPEEETEENDEKSKSESKRSRKSKESKHLSCPTCQRSFVSYVKLLQHQLSHKLKPESSSESGKKPLGDALKKPVTGTRNKKKKVVMVVTKTATKHKGGWPKGKSRKGYIPKRKRVASGKNTKKEETQETVAESNPNKNDEGSSDGGEMNSETLTSLLDTTKVPMEEQVKNKVLSVPHLEPCVLQRVKPKNKGSLPSSDSAPPPVVAS